MANAECKQPTVTAHDNFDAESDCSALYKAMKGWGTNEAAIINIIGSRTAAQLKEIEQKYKVSYGKDLQKHIKSEISGKFEDAVIGRFYNAAEFQAKCCREAMKGLGTNERALIDVLCTKSNEEMTALKEAYKTLYSRDLEADVKSEVSGHLERILVSTIQAQRETDPLNEALANKEAAELHEAGEGKKFGTDEATFNRIICLRSPEHLRKVFEEYMKLSGNDIETAIKKEMSGHVERAFLTIVRHTKDRSKYWAQVLYESMKGMGTDDRTLIRTILDRCEKDLGAIKDVYAKTYGKTLFKAVKDDTRGDYEKMLLALVGASE